MCLKNVIVGVHFLKQQLVSCYCFLAQASKNVVLQLLYSTKDVTCALLP